MTAYSGGESVVTAEEILAAALFDREGVDEVSVHEIATAAGVGKGTVFRRFGDRTALIAAVLTLAANSGRPPETGDAPGTR